MAKVRWTGRRRSFRSSPQRKVMFASGLLLAILGAIFFSIAPSASADTEQNTPAITEYATYPQADLIPDTCNADGPGVLQGISYTVTRGGQTSTVALDDSFKFQVGDVVKMTWAGYTPGCEGVGISLAVKRTDHPVFVLEDNQTLVSYQYCSGEDCNIPGVRDGLTLTIPAPQNACNFQLDAVIGPPLGNVGPLGSYYGENLRSQFNAKYPDSPNPKATGPNMLIGFSNGGRTDCQFPTASVTTSCTAVQGGPGAVVTVTNPDTQFDASIDVTKNGNLVVGGDDVAVAKNGGTANVNVPLAQAEVATISVIDNSDGQPITGWPQQITGPSGCSEETTTTTTTTSTTTTTTTTTTVPCEETTTTSIEGSTTTTNPVCETTTTTVEVEGSTTVPTSTIPPDTVQNRVLARTGSNSTSMMTTYAGILLVAGGALMALANWPAPVAAANRSRGR